MTYFFMTRRCAGLPPDVGGGVPDMIRSVATGEGEGGAVAALRLRLHVETKAHGKCISTRWCAERRRWVMEEGRGTQAGQ